MKPLAVAIIFAIVLLAGAYKFIGDSRMIAENVFGVYEIGDLVFKTPLSPAARASRERIREEAMSLVIEDSTATAGFTMGVSTTTRGSPSFTMYSTVDTWFPCEGWSGTATSSVR